MRIRIEGLFSGLLNVAVIQWRLQACAIQLNLDHVTSNITMEKSFVEALCPFMKRTDHRMAFAWCCCQIVYVARGGHKRLGC